MGRPSTRLKLWTGMPVNAPHVTQPISLRALLIVCILIPTGLLIYGVALRLAWGSYLPDSGTIVRLVVLYFALPIIVAVSILGYALRARGRKRPGECAVIGLAGLR